MTLKKHIKEKLNRIVFILNGSLFLIAGIQFMEDRKWIFAALQIVASVINYLVLVPFDRLKFQHISKYLVLIMNVIVCVSIAVDYILMGKKYLQYAWFLAAVVTIIAFIIQWRSGKKENIL